MRDTPYKTPLKKLVVFFEKSRDNWKAKYIETRKDLKRAKNQIDDLKRRKEMWKTRAIDTENRLKEIEEAKEGQIKKKILP